MPALSSTSLLHMNSLVNQSATATATNATSNVLQVICAWPVSGQYGPGSRVLYYVLIAACVLARKAEWLRHACLAAALLFPAVAALHSIVLAAVHVNGAVDMDVYGAFQLCSIGILAAPVTVRLSRTYFYNPGRNIIFLWTGLILAGLLSLTVEFFRITTSNCTHDDFGNPISPNAGKFLYNTTCGLTCSTEEGPYSPIRGNSASNIYVIPAPDKLTFDTATLLAAACCIPAILSLISMWNKILEINWKTRFGQEDENERIEGTNGATVEKMRGVNTLIRMFLSAVEIPLFVAAVLAILVLGERNFLSPQVKYQTEPLASIGQWAPIVGTGLAALGSLYLLLAADLEAVKEEVNPNASMHHCNCSMQEVRRGSFTASSHSVAIPGAIDMRRSSSDGGRGTLSEILPTTSRPAPGHQAKRSWTADAGNRRKVAKVLTATSNYLGTAAHDRFDDSEFKHGKALDFPEIPGEEHRNQALHQIREQYNQTRDANGNVTPLLREQPSRAGSSIGSVASGLDVGGSSTTPREASPQSPLSPHSPSPFPSPNVPQRPLASTLSAERTSFELQNPPSSSSAGLSRGKLRPRRDTLEVPSQVYHSSTQNNPSASSITSIVTMPDGQRSPTIVVSSDPDSSSPAHRPISNSPAPALSSEPLPTPPTATLPPLS